MDSESVKKIATLLQVSDIRSRRQAIIALGKSNHPEALKHLNWAVRNERDEELRALATQAIYDIRQANHELDDSALESIYIPSPVSDNSPSSLPKPQMTTSSTIKLYLRDYIFIGVFVGLILLVMKLAISGGALILFDDVVLAEGDTVADRIEQIQTALRSYRYDYADLAFEEINKIDGRLDMKDLIEFYKRRIGANLIIDSGWLYYTYTQQTRQDDKLIDLGWYQQPNKADVYHYTIAFFVINLVMIFVGISIFMGRFKSSQTILFQFVRVLVLSTGIPMFWMMVFVVSMVQIGLLVMLYLKGFTQFIYDLLIALGWETGHIFPQDVVGYEFFAIFAIWGVIATIALGSALFYPEQSDVSL